ncbi:bifunctional diguanylate cyclase/phosphodiesterase [Bacillus seohaeanensis]|uniref:EAL domain-containing protein n=1 Tax=Bacillus seohaeanensis TaxID=284580 RepID=A0ABW5RTL9_9BACI
MNKAAWKSRIFWRIFMVSFVAIISLIAFVFISSKLILPKISQEQFKQMTDIAVNRLTRQVDMVEDSMESISKASQQNKELLLDDVNKVNDELNKLVDMSTFFDGGTITDENGSVLASRSLNLEEYQNVSYLQYSMAFREEKKTYLSNVLTQRNNPTKSLILLSIPVYDDYHQLARVVHLSIHLNKTGLFQSIFQELNIGMDSYAYIVDSKGTLIAHPKRAMLGVNVRDNPAVKALLNKKSGYMKLVNQFDAEMYSSYQYVPGLKWGIVAQVPVETTYLGMEKFHKFLLMASIIIVILLTMLTAYHSMRTIKPLRKLYEAVDHVAKGDYQASIENISEKDEIGILSRRFNEMISSLKVMRIELELKEKSLQVQKEFLRKIIDNSPSAIYIMDWEGRYTLANKAFADLLGMTPRDIIGKKEDDFNPNQEEVDFYLSINREVIKTKEERFIPEATIFDSEGNQHWMQVVKVPILEEAGRSHSVLCFATNITERIKNEEKIKFHASHDNLTKLPNRFLFKQCIEQEMELAKVEQSQFAVLFMDLDRFKYVNDHFGHSMGDKLLQAVTARLKENLHERDTIARLGGDEFTVILPTIDDKQQISSIASKLIQALAEPYQIDGQSFVTTTSIGVGVYPNDGEDVETLIKNADTAMYQAKNQGKNTYRFFHHEMQSMLSNKFKLESSMRGALERNEFHLHYQPKMDTKTGKLSGMEALLRWEQKELGMVSPAEFIPIAEETGMIIPIGEWVLKTACLQNKQWQEAGHAPKKIAVNLSVKQMEHNNIVRTVRKVLKETELDPIWLELEITETAIMENKNTIIRTLSQLKRLGVSIAIDDFGTGYSSLNYLKRFPADTLKIDRSFIQDLLSGKNDTVIATAVISMATELGLNIVAEGVETEEQLQYLYEQACNEVQGFLISPPVSTDKMEKLLTKEQLYDYPQ